jgi:hypothetical protein
MHWDCICFFFISPFTHMIVLIIYPRYLNKVLCEITRKLWYLYATWDLLFSSMQMAIGGVSRICSRKFVLKSVHDSFMSDHPYKKIMSRVTNLNKNGRYRSIVHCLDALRNTWSIIVNKINRYVKNYMWMVCELIYERLFRKM